MKSFDSWLTEMANLFPQRKGDTLEKSRTTHMGFPVNSPTVYWIITNRDPEKYPDGMTATEIAAEVLERSEKRTDLRPGEQEAPDDWKEMVRGQKWTKFIRGLNSMLAKSPDFVAVGRREKQGGRGRNPAIYMPTDDAIRRRGGSKFLKKQDRATFRPSRPEEIETPKDIEDKGEAELNQMLQSFLDPEDK